MLFKDNQNLQFTIQSELLQEYQYQIHSNQILELEVLQFQFQCSFLKQV
ncbi:unnamed protein product [Paramecium sonneborni]|uniref:Uncharacterized protein n=1 Tax=Paramecium sonneborni TaxID=65129 RepID=A0A8S1JXT8_9CILI|nr:unnamed protein product [Paramecium sonneborni]